MNNFISRFFERRRQKRREAYNAKFYNQKTHMTVDGYGDWVDSRKKKSTYSGGYVDTSMTADATSFGTFGAIISDTTPEPTKDSYSGYDGGSSGGGGASSSWDSSPSYSSSSYDSSSSSSYDSGSSSSGGFD